MLPTIVNGHTVVKDADGELVLYNKGEPLRKAKYAPLHMMHHLFVAAAGAPTARPMADLSCRERSRAAGHCSITTT
jgi:uncharacterized protein YfaQ (DUF2300 family)